MPYSSSQAMAGSQAAVRSLARSTRRKAPLDRLLLNAIAYFVLGAVAFLTVFPFFVLLVNSFASEHYIINFGYTLLPRELSLDAYELVFLNPQKILTRISHTA